MAKSIFSDFLAIFWPFNTVYFLASSQNLSSPLTPKQKQTLRTIIEGEEGEGGEKEINLIEYSTGAGKTDIQQLRFDEGGDDWDIFDDWYYI